MEKKIELEAFWAFTKAELLKILESREGGLAQEEAKERKKRFGPNELASKHGVATLDIALRQFRSPLIFILVAAGSITLVLRDVIDSGVIFLAVLVNAALGFYQEYRAEEALTHLRSYLKERTRVIRENNEQEVDVTEVVPGDVVRIISGSRVPADIRLLSTNNLEVDESILTGESLPVSKSIDTLPVATELADRANAIFGGTLVVGGSGIGVVCRTGITTEIGKISEFVAAASKTETPLQRNIRRLAWGITVVLGVFIVAVFILGVARGESVLMMFLVAVAMAVGAIPEALPVAMTMILAIGVERLAKRNAIVRKLAAAESLGSTTVILTDKTGTLTEARVKLEDIIPASKAFRYRSVGEIGTIEAASDVQKEILRTALMNADVLIENPNSRPSEWRMVGSLLECNIVRAAAELGMNVAEIKNENAVFLAHPFNSKDKFSIALVKKTADANTHQGGSTEFLSILGAPEVLLERSELSKDAFVGILSTVHALAGEGKRLLGVAVKPLGRSGEKHINPDTIRGFTFLGIIAFRDPVRPEIARAMARVEQFGVRTVMVTGDLMGTALAVAREIGWDVSEANVIGGVSLRAMDDETLTAALPRTRIFARVSPEDKVRILKLYRLRGEVVAMTGDGVNDAPSLKSADVGIAVGSGTDVAKDVADLVLLDNNFKTIAAAIEEGRRILSNIRKATIYLLSDAFDEVFLIGGSLAFGLALPLSPLQILWVNFFSDSFPALAFAFERNSEYGVSGSEKRGRIIDRRAKFLIFVVGVLTSALLFVFYAALLSFGFDAALVRSFIFASFGTYTLFLVFPLRNLEESIFSYPVLTNRLMLSGVGLGVVLMAIAIYVPSLQEVLGTVPLSPVWVLGVVALVALNIAAVEATKLMFRLGRKMPRDEPASLT